ncbi:hypothetical protein ACU686_21075 [Yinghuangia aomiensis]
MLVPWGQGEGDHIWVRPAAFTGADDLELLRLVGLGGEYRGHGLRSLQEVLGADFDRVFGTGGIGGEVHYAQDPSRSVPDLVAEVAKTHEIGDDAATLYLQLLALPDPTDRNAARWTGWKPARLKKARAELAATDLVVTARRARAAARCSCPAAGTSTSAPCSLEVWKDGLYLVADAVRGILPEDPVDELFVRAWQRVAEGDAPGFEQLETRTRRDAADDHRHHRTRDRRTADPAAGGRLRRRTGVPGRARTPARARPRGGHLARRGHLRHGLRRRAQAPRRVRVDDDRPQVRRRTLPRGTLRRDPGRRARPAASSANPAPPSRCCPELLAAAVWRHQRTHRASAPRAPPRTS